MEKLAINIDQIAFEISEKVSSQIEIEVALIGLAGVVIGAFLQVVGQGVIELIRGCPKRKLDKQREELLEKMFSADKVEWRKIETLSRVIGTNEEETKRLLIKIGARGSEKDNDVWALIKNKPLNEIKY